VAPLQGSSAREGPLLSFPLGEEEALVQAWAAILTP
jgi:hypothetical protein